MVMMMMMIKDFYPSRRHYYFVSGSCGGRAFAFSFIVFRTKLCTRKVLRIFSVSTVAIMFCVQTNVDPVQCHIAVCKICTLAGLCKKELSLTGGRLSSPRCAQAGARPCRGSQPQITACCHLNLKSAIHRNSF